jgi:ABC-type glycerol-3-phosphate transport system substrate-binding protein
MQFRPSKKTLAAITAFAVASTLTIATGAQTASAAGFYKGKKVTIELRGPNQWNNNAKSFGPEWDKLIKDFQAAEPNITVKTVVQPLSTFYATNSTQLAAGTAGDLVFRQAKYTPEMVTNIDPYLKKPNPYIKGNKKWIDAFDSNFYGYKKNIGPNANGNMEWIPFNLIGIGVFANTDLAKKAGVKLPIKDFTSLFAACKKYKAAGVAPWGWDNSFLPISWTWRVISSMYMQDSYNSIDQFKADGTAGAHLPVGITDKSKTKAILEGKLKATDPQIQASLKMLKRFVDECATENWSGITNNNGAVTAYDDFFAGRAAMTWGVSFGLASLNSAKFKSTIFAFPTIDKAADPLASGKNARWGVGVGGTEYMIPASTKGDKLAAAVLFMQFLSSPKGLAWAGTSGGISPIKGKSSGVSLGDGGSDWGKPQIIWAPAEAPGKTVRSIFDGLLLGTKTVAETTETLQQNWDEGAKQAVKDNKWEEESWAK